MSPQIDADRLWRSIQTLAQVGAYADVLTGLTGVNRLALTDADRDGRNLVRQWFADAGLQVRVDRIGNVIGRREGLSSNELPVMSGSHIDSVPTGGAFDGALGVLGALEVVRALNDAGVVTRRPLEIAFFTDEEGARFGTDMLGSATACGRLALADALALRDKDAVSVGEALARIGYLGEHPERLVPPRAYVELHVEQGPILEAAGMQLGVVTGVQAISWQEVTIVGKSAHAGTTPMNLRRDAGLMAAELNVELHRMVASGRYGADMRATMGRLDLIPNRVNIVPARAICTVDLRNPRDDLMEKAEAELASWLEKRAQECGLEVQRRQTARTNSVRFDPGVIDVLTQKIEARGLRYQRILSGAGHDAQEMAAVCPTAMIFVPGLYDGISHNPREYSTPEACARGCQILLETVLALAE